MTDRHGRQMLGAIRPAREDVEENDTALRRTNDGEVVILAGVAAILAAVGRQRLGKALGEADANIERAPATLIADNVVKIPQPSSERLHAGVRLPITGRDALSRRFDAQRRLKLSGPQPLTRCFLEPDIRHNFVRLVVEPHAGDDQVGIGRAGELPGFDERRDLLGQQVDDAGRFAPPTDRRRSSG